MQKYVLIFIFSILSCVSCASIDTSITTDQRSAKKSFEKAVFYAIHHEFDIAEKYFLDAINLDPENAQYLNGYMMMHYTTRNYEKALELGEQYLDLLKKNNADAETIRSATLNLGVLYIHCEQYSIGKDYCERALTIAKNIYKEPTNDFPVIYNNIGMSYYMLGDPDHAIEFFEKSLCSFEQLGIIRNNDLALTYGGLGCIYLGIEQYTEAIMHFQKAIEINKQLHPLPYEDIARDYNNMGLAYMRKDNEINAKDCYNSALEILLRHIPSGKHTQIRDAYENLASLCMKQGDREAAMEYLSKAMESMPD